MDVEKLLPPGETPTTPTTPTNPSPMPSPKAQSWGTILSIIIIVLMIIIGAFYAWGQRISENIVPATSTATQ